MACVLLLIGVLFLNGSEREKPGAVSMRLRILFGVVLLLVMACGSHPATNYGADHGDEDGNGRGSTPLPRTSSPYQRPVQVGVAGGTAQGREVIGYRMIHNLGETFNKNASR